MLPFSVRAFLMISRLLLMLTHEIALSKGVCTSYFNFSPMKFVSPLHMGHDTNSMVEALRN